MQQLENNIPTAFLHQNWQSQRQNWLKAINMCNKAKDFALALAILESCIKPVLFTNAWNDNLGECNRRSGQLCVGVLRQKCFC